jgi:riboflavin synthase alpha subunit
MVPNFCLPIASPNLAAAVNCGESVCTIGICYVVNKIILPSKFNVKLQKKNSQNKILKKFSKNLKKKSLFF